MLITEYYTVRLQSLQIRLNITDSIKPFVHSIRVQVRSIRCNAVFIFILVVRHGPPTGRLGLVFDILGHGELEIIVLVSTFSEFGGGKEGGVVAYVMIVLLHGHYPRHIVECHRP